MLPSGSVKLALFISLTHTTFGDLKDICIPQYTPSTLKWCCNAGVDIAFNRSSFVAFRFLPSFIRTALSISVTSFLFIDSVMETCWCFPKCGLSKILVKRLLCKYERIYTGFVANCSKVCSHHCI